MNWKDADFPGFRCGMHEGQFPFHGWRATVSNFATSPRESGCLADVHALKLNLGPTIDALEQATQGSLLFGESRHRHSALALKSPVAFEQRAA